MSGHLLHVGYPKAGSTYLQRWFEAHPQLAYRDAGIAGFRDVYEIARAGARGEADPLYRVTSTESLSLPTADSGAVVIDYKQRRSTDMIAAQLRVCQMLAKLFPGAVVLVVTRGYAALFLSTYSQFIRSGGSADLSDQIAGARTRWFNGGSLWKKLFPGKVVTGSMIPDDVVEKFRGHAERLRENPLYAPYRREYLLD